MSLQVKNMILEAEALTPTEQLELMTAITELLQNSQQKVTIANDFWTPKTLNQLANEQQVNPVQSISDLSSDFWPEEETVDDFNEFIYQQRHDDRINN